MVASPRNHLYRSTLCISKRRFFVLGHTLGEPLIQTIQTFLQKGKDDALASAFERLDNAGIPAPEPRINMHCVTRAESDQVAS